MPGFTTAHARDIGTGVGATIERTVILSLDGVQQSVTIEAYGSRIEARASGLEDTAAESIASDNLLSANFGQPNVFVDPRRVMLGVRLNLGK